jgi:hypothetical protein
MENYNLPTNRSILSDDRFKHERNYLRKHQEIIGEASALQKSSELTAQEVTPEFHIKLGKSLYDFILLLCKTYLPAAVAVTPKHGGHKHPLRQQMLNSAKTNLNSQCQCVVGNQFEDHHFEVSLAKTIFYSINGFFTMGRQYRLALYTPLHPESNLKILAINTFISEFKCLTVHKVFFDLGIISATKFSPDSDYGDGIPSPIPTLDCDFQFLNDTICPVSSITNFNELGNVSYALCQFFESVGLIGPQSALSDKTSSFVSRDITTTLTQFDDLPSFEGCNQATFYDSFALVTLQSNYDLDSREYLNEKSSTFNKMLFILIIQPGFTFDINLHHPMLLYSTSMRNTNLLFKPALILDLFESFLSCDQLLEPTPQKEEITYGEQPVTFTPVVQEAQPSVQPSGNQPVNDGSISNEPDVVNGPPDPETN